MRESKRPAAAGDAEGPQSADADAAAAGGAGEGASAGGDVAAARLHRAGKRKEGAADAEADAFNTRHAAEVAEFNGLTKDACLGEDGKVDAAAVKKWQRDHHVAPDGKIGPKTLAAATGKPLAPGADAQLAKAAVPKPKGPIDDVMAWIDASPVHVVLEQLGVLSASGKGADKNAKQDKSEAAEKPPDVTGLASDVSIAHFVEAAATLEKESVWRGLSPHDRASKLLNAANVQLIAAGCMELDFKFDPAMSKVNPGKFMGEKWAMHLFQEPFTARKLDGKTATSLVDTVYHEARHAEQNFRIARLLAGQGMKPAQIKEKTNLKKEAIEAAAAKPMPAGAPEAEQAQAMFDDKYGAGKAHHEAAEKTARVKLTAYKEVQKRVEDPSASEEDRAAAQRELDAMKPDVMAAWEAYKALATEADALPTGQRAAAAMEHAGAAK